MEWDISQKIALLGDAAVGKTSLQSRYMGLGFKDNYQATLGTNFSSKLYQTTLRDGSGKNVRVFIYDMGGQEQYKVIRKRFFDGVSGCILVFDVTRPYDPQNQILPWVKEILEFTEQEGVPMAILGNKVDLQFLRQIPTYSGFNVAIDTRGTLGDRHNVEYFETSAKDGTGVDEAFNWLIDEIINAVFYDD
ncbi:MAG: Rab family GTPase [Candidatus Kariarchaeaceae archaeon]|jgi:small GTP-binding protein